MNGLAVDIAFAVFGLASVWFGWRVFRTDSMVRASFSLLVSFLNVGAILVLLLAEYLGVALFFMMAIEMTVMALFMVAFMMNPAGLNPMRMVHQHRVSIGLGAAGAAGLGTVALVARFPARPVTDVTGRIEALGTELLGGSMLIFESAGIALLATMLGAVVLSARSSRFGGAADEGSHPPPLVPGDPESVPDVSPDEEGGGPAHHAHGDHGEAS
ncbi:MAG: NADH-quinone oxidoreductase subunit J [Myxococcota bacterium]